MIWNGKIKFALALMVKDNFWSKLLWILLFFRFVDDYALKNNFTHFSSTLVTSEYQDTAAITSIANNLSNKLNIKFYIPQHICCDLKTTGFYKQFFCGCVYSLTERYQEKYS